MFLLPLCRLADVKYTYVGISINELNDLHLYCSDKELARLALLTPPGACEVPSGEQMKAKLGLDQYTMGGCAGILILYIVFCRVVAFLGVRFIKW